MYKGLLKDHRIVCNTYSGLLGSVSKSGQYSETMTIYAAEMRGYRFLISVSYPYPLKTIRILSVQTLITDIRVLSVSVVLLWYDMTP